jgi:pilus assembly protein Flp/PilA
MSEKSPVRPSLPLPGGIVPSGYLARRMAARHASKGLTMSKLFVSVQNLLATPLRRDDRGATAVEYGLIVALIAVVIVASVTAVGLAISGKLGSVAGSI